jgi:hypothetical protein
LRKDCSKNKAAARVLLQRSGQLLVHFMAIGIGISATVAAHHHDTGEKQKNKYTAEQDGSCIVNCNKGANIIAVVKM